jgi:hypothetical protein
MHCLDTYVDRETACIAKSLTWTERLHALLVTYVDRETA